MKSHRSYTPDPSRLIAYVLWPLLALNGLLWILYAHAPFMASVWFLMGVASLFYVRQT